MWDWVSGNGADRADAMRAIVHGGKQTPGVRVLVWGPEKSVEAVQRQLEPLLATTGLLGGYRQKLLHAFLAKDPPGGPRDAGSAAVHRMAFLASPGQMKSTYGYITSHLPWTPSIIAYLLHVLDLSREHLWALVSGNFTHVNPNRTKESCKHGLFQ